jgi:hypothetical protein
MSTFDGRVAEFPDIQIDHFRSTVISGRAVRAAFLSHVHTDHLVGLESTNYVGPFIYCSPATREVLLRLEKYPHRMNFASGILESRKQTFKHLKRLLKPIPLETPTWIELEPGRRIRVTLFDANHCVGAVMFLIEGDGIDAKAILYTGDIRSERWWVDSLFRYPILNQYLSHFGKEPRKRLDMIYLDTTFASKTDRYKHFPSKAEGISELLEKVAAYPRNTRFYFDSWTFGYEDVWQALSAHFDAQIHVDQFKYGVYRSLGNSLKGTIAPEYFKLIVSHYGNHEQAGCLATGDDSKFQLHSCEQGTGCSIWSKSFVRITPIISRHNGQSMREPGAGGGDGDLNLRHELEFHDAAEFGQLMQLLIQNLSDDRDRCAKVMKMVADDMQARGTVSLDLLDIWPEGEDRSDSQAEAEMEDLTPEKVILALVRRAEKPKIESGTAEPASDHAGNLPKQILFPFSRHASYGELCLLIEAFRPKDIYPCTVVPLKHWKPVHSMAHLFGHLFQEPPIFHHDHFMLRKMNDLQKKTATPRKESSPVSRQTTPDEDVSDHGMNSTPSPLHQKMCMLQPRDKNERRESIPVIPQPKQDEFMLDAVVEATPSPAENVISGALSAVRDITGATASQSNKRRKTSETNEDRAPRRHSHIETIEISSNPASREPSPGPIERQANAESVTPNTRVVEVPESPLQTRATSSVGAIPRPTSSKDRQGVDISALHTSIQEPGERTRSSTAAPISTKRQRSTPDRRPPIEVGSPRWRDGMRQEAFHAVMGMNGRQWSDIELISVRGHSFKEEEL